MAQVLSDRDAARIQAMLRRDERRTDSRYNRRRHHGRGGGGKPRKAYASAAAGASGTIACYLDTDGAGDTVDVVCEIVGGSALNSALPRIADGTMIPVWNDNGTWRPYFPFQASGDC